MAETAKVPEAVIPPDDESLSIYCFHPRQALSMVPIEACEVLGVDWYEVHVNQDPKVKPYFIEDTGHRLWRGRRGHGPSEFATSVEGLFRAPDAETAEGES